MIEIMQASADAIADEGIDYRGVLYGGFILTAEGPKLLEFNARFGDPETQVVLPRLETDLAEMLLACAEGRLAERRARVESGVWPSPSCSPAAATRAATRPASPSRVSRPLRRSRA